jgi:hypothetical protein
VSVAEQGQLAEFCAHAELDLPVPAAVVTGTSALSPCVRCVALQGLGLEQP